MNTLVQLARELWAIKTLPGVTWAIGIVAWIAAMPFIPRHWLDEGSFGSGSVWAVGATAFTSGCFLWQWRRDARKRV